jgi:hypothetical protein
MILKTTYGEYVIGGIYRHYKGNYYKIESVSFLHDSQNVYLINYHQCDENGVFISIRKTEEETVYQPFATHETRWNDMIRLGTGEVKRFTFIK